MPSSQGHPDEVVAQISEMKEVPSELVAESKLRHEFAKTEYATPQEQKQAAVEEAHALSTRPDGSYAQLHETEEPRLAVADESRVAELKEQQDEAIGKLEGSAPASSPAGVKQQEDAAKSRDDAASKADKAAAPKADKGFAPK